MNPILINLAINCKVVSVLVRGRKTPWSEQVLFLSPYDPPPFRNAAKGDTPLETPTVAGGVWAGV